MDNFNDLGFSENAENFESPELARNAEVYAERQKAIDDLIRRGKKFAVLT